MNARMELVGLSASIKVKRHCFRFNYSSQVAELSRAHLIAFNSLVGYARPFLH